MQIVNRNTPKMLPRPCKSRPNKKAAHYQVECSECGHIRWLTKYHADLAEQNNTCKRCHCRAAGQRGYEAAVKNGFREKALAGVAAYQLENASKPELTVAAWLAYFDIPHRRQVIFENYILDFVTDTCIIEVNGGYWHQNRTTRDTWIAENAPLPVLFLDAELVVKSPEIAKQQLLAMLGE